MLFLSVILPQTTPSRLKYPQKSEKTTCSFCGERHKRNDGRPLLPLSHQLTKLYFISNLLLRCMRCRWKIIISD